MSKSLWRRLLPAPSMAVAFVALLVALGGSSYAAVKIAKNGVQSKHIKNGAVTTAKLKSNAVTGAKVLDNSLTGADVNETTLTLPAQTTNYVIKKQNFAVETAGVGPCSPPQTGCSIPITKYTTGTVNCDPGQVAISGGAQPDDVALNFMTQSYPTGGVGWASTVGNDDTSRPHGFVAFVVCAPGAVTNAP